MYTTMNKTGKLPVHRAYILVTKHIKNQHGDKGDKVLAECLARKLVYSMRLGELLSIPTLENHMKILLYVFSSKSQQGKLGL